MLVIPLDVICWCYFKICYKLVISQGKYLSFSFSRSPTLYALIRVWWFYKESSLFLILIRSNSLRGNPHWGPEYGPPYILATKISSSNDQRIQNPSSPNLLIRAFTEHDSSLASVILTACILECISFLEWHLKIVKMSRFIETGITQTIFMLTSHFPSTAGFN